MMGLAAPALLAGLCPSATPAPDGTGATAVAPVPSLAAQALNAEGYQLYRQGRWQDAWSRYRAAAEADPGYLGPALNAACALARQERFADAARDAAALVRRAFVPWGREVLEATDLAALHPRPEMQAVRAALAESAAAWGASLGEGLFFVARTGLPVRLAGQGVLVLALAQEVFAWLPRTGGYRQVTAEDGRVLAFVRSDDGRSLLYVRAGKLVRNAGAQPALRALSLRRLEVPTMSPGQPIALSGDVASLELRLPVGSAPEVQVFAPGQRPRLFRLQGDELRPAPAPAPRPGPVVRLTAAGVPETTRALDLPGCPLRASDDRTGPTPRVRVSSKGRAILLDTRHGAGLAGLPFPEP
jgi:hypothetical protein